MNKEEIISNLHSIMEHMCDNCGRVCKECNKSRALYSAIKAVEEVYE